MNGPTINVQSTQSQCCPEVDALSSDHMVMRESDDCDKERVRGFIYPHIMSMDMSGNNSTDKLDTNVMLNSSPKDMSENKSTDKLDTNMMSNSSSKYFSGNTSTDKLDDESVLPISASTYTSPSAFTTSGTKSSSVKPVGHVLVKDRKLHTACHMAPKPRSFDYDNERRRDYVSILNKAMIHKCHVKCDKSGNCKFGKKGKPIIKET